MDFIQVNDDIALIWGEVNSKFYEVTGKFIF